MMGKEGLDIGTSTSEIAITSDFRGADLTIFGALTNADQLLLAIGQYDVVVTLEGPREETTVRRKDRLFGIWMNRTSMTFERMPISYSLASTRPVEQIAPAQVLTGHGIGIDHLALTPTGYISYDANITEFRDAFRRIKQSHGLLVFAALVLGIAALVPRLYVRDAPVPEARAAVVQPAAPSSYGRSVTLQKGSNGHFEADAVIDGRRMGFLVDTGASVIALRENDAARLGIHPARRDYTANVSTANGTIKAAPVELNRVEVGGLTVRNVAAMVLPDEALSHNLLGMSFLSKVKWEHRNGRLILEQ